MNKKKYIKLKVSREYMITNSATGSSEFKESDIFKIAINIDRINYITPTKEGGSCITLSSLNEDGLSEYFITETNFDELLNLIENE